MASTKIELTEQGYQSALHQRIDDILDACTRCGACVKACPITEPAELSEAEPEQVVTGVLDILRAGKGPEEAEKWATSCVYSGACIEACNYGINPRFMLAMARVAMNRDRATPSGVRRNAVKNYSTLTRSVRALARLQLPEDMLVRLNQIEGPIRSAAGGRTDQAPDFVLYTGCNILKTPHIALLALDILDALGMRYEVTGGPKNCCGIVHGRAGDTRLASRMGLKTIDTLRATGTSKVINWCASCHVTYTEITLPTIEGATGEKPLDMTPFMLFLEDQAERLKPLLKHPVRKRIGLHRHSGIPGVSQAAERLLRIIPGVEFVDLGQPEVSLMSNFLAPLPKYQKQLHLAELEAAREAEIDALVAVYHSDHRELCAHEQNWPFEILNVLDVIGEAMGQRRDDQYKRLKLMQDADAIMADCADLIARHEIDPAEARTQIEAMLLDQPLALDSTVDAGQSD